MKKVLIILIFILLFPIPIYADNCNYNSGPNGIGFDYSSFKCGNYLAKIITNVISDINILAWINIKTGHSSSTYYKNNYDPISVMQYEIYKDNLNAPPPKDVYKI